MAPATAGFILSLSSTGGMLRLSSPNAGPHVPRVELETSVEAPDKDTDCLAAVVGGGTAIAGETSSSSLSLLSESDPVPLPDSDPLLLESDPLLLESDPLPDSELLLPSEVSSGAFRAMATAVTPAPLAAPIAAAVPGAIPSFDSTC